MLLSQPTVCDPSRAPAGKHTLWAYCHVPSGSTVDMTDRVERQIERFAPGFRDRVLARSAMNAVEIEAYNPNYVGGDIGAGAMDLRQLFTRPAVRPVPYTTPDPRLFICSVRDPARPRRARHVRLLRRAGGAAPAASVLSVIAAGGATDLPCRGQDDAPRLQQRHRLPVHVRAAALGTPRRREAEDALAG